MRRVLWVVLGLAIVSIAAIVAACGDNSSTSPAPPGGGSPVTFNFTFPAQNVSHSFTFTTAGSYAYRCTPHQGAGMTGTVTVDAASANDSALVSVGFGGSSVFNPSAVTIKPGGSVRWVNVSTVTIHTVTR